MTTERFRPDIVDLNATFLPTLNEATALQVVDDASAKRAGSILQALKGAVKFLKEGGRLVSIMSAGVRYRDTKLNRELNVLLAAHDGTVQDLPDGAFKSAGTMVKTVVVTLDK